MTRINAHALRVRPQLQVLTKSATLPFGQYRLEAGVADNRSAWAHRPLTYSLPSNENALLRDWAPRRVPVFFDFGEPILWRLSPRSPNGWANLSPVLKTTFLDALSKGNVSRACLRLALLYSMLLRRYGLQVSSDTWLGSKGRGDAFSATPQQRSKRDVRFWPKADVSANSSPCRLLTQGTFQLGER